LADLCSARVNTKITLRVPFEAIEKRVPKLLHEELRNHHYYAKNSDSLVITADGSRHQKENLNDAFQKLEGLLRRIGGYCIEGETSEIQRGHVENL
jgi:peptidyl-tRNA hydrolase ICT1